MRTIKVTRPTSSLDNPPPPTAGATYGEPVHNNNGDLSQQYLDNPPPGVVVRVVTK